jgi:branched-chain amino acid transport system permease protein
MEVFFSQLVNGLSVGSTYALVALGVVLIFSVLDVLSLAQGEIFIFSAYIGFVWILGLTGNMAWAIAAVLMGAVALGAFVERVAIRPALSGGHMGTLITTVGVGIVLTNLLTIIFGPFSHVVPNDAFVEPWRIGAATIRPIDALALITLLAGFTLVSWIINRTGTGIAVRATAENSEVASTFGVRVQAVRTWTFALGSGFAGWQLSYFL